MMEHSTEHGIFLVPFRLSDDTFTIVPGPETIPRIYRDISSKDRGLDTALNSSKPWTDVLIHLRHYFWHMLNYFAFDSTGGDPVGWFENARLRLSLHHPSDRVDDVA